MSAKTTVNTGSSIQALLTFDDEFNTFNAWNDSGGTWQYAYSWAPDGVDTSGGWFVNPTWGPTSAANVDPYSVSNGVLSIGLIPTPASVLSSVDNQPFLTGQVETQESFSQLYGYFEVNAEAAATPGIDSAFWLLPENGAWPPELDVFEILGSQPTNVYMTAHYGASNSITQNWATVSDATTAFNTYAVDWEANYITWYINGKQVAQIATPASMDVPMYMLLDIAAGTTGSWAGQPASGATGHMLVNWVHAYSSDPYLSANDTVVTAGSAAAITDHAGNTWTINGSGQVAINGTADAATSGVTEIAFVNATIWKETSAGLWSGETQPNDSWTAATTTNPLTGAALPPSPNDTVVKAGSAATIIDASGNAWTITGGSQVAVNGATSQGTANVVEMAYVNGTIWQENTLGLWYGENQPNDSWTAGTTISPLPAGVAVASGTQNATPSGGPAFSPNILFQNQNGQMAQWTVSGSSIASGGLIGANPGPSWFAMGTGAFYTGDTSDIVWQNTNGEVALWQVQGTTLLGGAAVSANPGTSWHIKGTGDFYGDGNTDILWQNDNGSVALWDMNGATIAGGGLVITNPGPTWHIEGTGDFYADGHTDILWQNDNGSVAIWDMSGTSIVQGAVVAANPGSTWHIKGTGDFYGDGNTDILWQNDNGSVAIWDMQGSTIAGGGIVAANPGPTWHIEGVGDFNNDGKTDIAWQNDNGSVAVWDMDGTNIVSGAVLANPGTLWSMLGGDENMRFIYSGSAGETLAAMPVTPEEFVFTNPAAGAHTTSGFDVTQDAVELSSALFPSFADVQAATTATAAGALISLGSSSLFLAGVVPGSLHASNFALA